MKKIHLLVGIIPTTLCIFAPTFSLTSCGNGDKKEDQLTVTYDVGSKGKIIESSSVSFNKDKQWSQITKPIVSCDESQKIDYWTKDSVQINDTDKFTSNFTATAHYTDLVNDEKHTEVAHTLATYNNLHFYLPSDYYDGSKYTFKNYSTFHEFTYTIDIDELKPDKGIKYFWLTQSNLNNVNLKKKSYNLICKA